MEDEEDPFHSDAWKNIPYTKTKKENKTKKVEDRNVNVFDVLNELD